MDDKQKLTLHDATRALEMSAVHHPDIDLISIDRRRLAQVRKILDEEEERMVRGDGDASFEALVVPSTSRAGQVSVRSSEGRVRQFYAQFSNACAALGLTSEVVTPSPAKVQITIRRLDG